MPFRESELRKNGFFEIMRELIYQWIGVCITPDWWTEADVNKALISFLASELVIDVSFILQIYTIQKI